MNKLIIISSFIAMSLTQASAIPLTGDHKKIDDIIKSSQEKERLIMKKIPHTKKDREDIISYVTGCSSHSKTLSDVKTCQATAIKSHKIKLKIHKHTVANSAAIKKIMTDTIKKLEALEIADPVVKK